MKINEIIKDSFDFTIDKSKNELIQLVRDKKLNLLDINWGIDGNGQLEILRIPMFFSPYRPYGKIVIIVIAIDEFKSRLTGETHPFNGNLPIILFLLLSGLGLWTIGVLLTIKISIALLMIILAWLAFGLLLLITYKYYKWGLMNYLKKVVNELRTAKKPAANTVYAP